MSFFLKNSLYSLDETSDQFLKYYSQSTSDDEIYQNQTKITDNTKNRDQHQHEDILLFKKKKGLIGQNKTGKFNKKMKLFENLKTFIDISDQIKSLNKEDQIKAWLDQKTHLEKIRCREKIQNLAQEEYVNTDDFDMFNEDTKCQQNEEEPQKQTQQSQQTFPIEIQRKTKGNEMMPKRNYLDKKLPEFEEKAPGDNIDLIGQLHQYLQKDKFKFPKIPDFEGEFEFYEKIEEGKLFDSTSPKKHEFYERAPKYQSPEKINPSSFRNRFCFSPTIKKPIDKKMVFQEDAQYVEAQHLINFVSTSKELINYMNQKSQGMYSGMKSTQRSKRDTFNQTTSPLSPYNNSTRRGTIFKEPILILTQIEDENNPLDKHKEDANEINNKTPNQLFSRRHKKSNSELNLNSNLFLKNQSIHMKYDKKVQITENDNEDSALKKKKMLINPMLPLKNNKPSQNIDSVFSQNLKSNKISHRLRGYQIDPLNMLKKEFECISTQSSPRKSGLNSPKVLDNIPSTKNRFNTIDIRSNKIESQKMEINKILQSMDELKKETKEDYKDLIKTKNDLTLSYLENHDLFNKKTTTLEHVKKLSDPKENMKKLQGLLDLVANIKS